jgi:hypothetical protein
MAEPTQALGAERSKAVLAEVRTVFLNRLSRSVAAAGVSSPVATEALRRGAGRFFDDMAERGVRPGFEQAAGLTASRIMLVDDKQLELSIRLDELSRRLFDHCAVILTKLHQRFITLLGRLDLVGTDLPVGADGVRAGLAELLAAFGASHAESLSRLAQIGDQLCRELPVVYAEINELLASRDVRPARLPQVEGDYGGAGIRLRPDSRKDDPLSSLQRVVFGSRAPATGAVGGNSPLAAVPAGTGDAAAAALNTALLEQLLAQLNAHQQQSDLDLFPDAASRPDQLQSLKAGELAPMLRGQDAACLDVLALLFEAMFNDPRLPDAVKAAMARLQIPLLKVAILDPSFFSDRGHPARVLLDTMAMTAVGLELATDGDHPVCVELRRVAVAVQTEFARDVEIFSRLAAELESFIARRDHDLLIAAQRFVPLAESQEEHEVAALEAQRAVRTREVAQAPRPIADFLDRDWRQVLALAWRSGGEDGKAWQESKTVMEDLLWSVQAKGDNQERARLATLVPNLLRRINDGLHRVSVMPHERAAFFDACFALQTAALRGSPIASELGPRPEVRAGSDAAELVTRQVDDLTLKAVRLREPASGGAGSLVASLQVGDWVEFHRPDGAIHCGCLSWVGPMLGLRLFANPEWNYAICIAPSILEKQLAVGEATVRDAHALFDGAADKALRALARAV